MFRFVSCFALVAIATAAYIPSGNGYPSSKHASRKVFHHAAEDEPKAASAEHHQSHHHHHEEQDHFVDYYAPINYKFEYGVKNPHTGDHKTHWEERDGDVVKGAYTVLDADGSSRLVEYTADPHHGFNAVVKKIEHAHIPKKEHHVAPAHEEPQEEHQHHQHHQADEQVSHKHQHHYHHYPMPEHHGYGFGKGY